MRIEAETSASISAAVKVSSLTVANAGESVAGAVVAGVGAGVAAGLAAALFVVAGFVVEVRVAARRRGVWASAAVATVAINNKARGFGRFINCIFSN